MKINTNNPALNSYIENLNKTILSNVNIEKYFTINKDKKVAIQYLTLKLVKKYVGIKSNLSKNDLLDIIKVLQKKNEDLENYEFASTLKDVINNFDLLSSLVDPSTKQKKVVKTEKKPDEQ